MAETLPAWVQRWSPNVDGHSMITDEKGGWVRADDAARINEPCPDERPECTEDEHFFAPNPKDGDGCKCGESFWEFEADRILRSLLHNVMMEHPLPWRLDSDWSEEVWAADGTRVFTSQKREDCERVVALANEMQAEGDALERELFPDEHEQSAAAPSNSRAGSNG